MQAEFAAGGYTLAQIVWHAAGGELVGGIFAAMIELACGNGVYRNFARAEAAQGAVLEDLAGKGVETRSLSPSLLSILEEASTAVLEEEASADREFARVLTHQRTFREKYARWQALAYPGPSGGAADGD